MNTHEPSLRRAVGLALPASPSTPRFPSRGIILAVAIAALYAAPLLLPSFWTVNIMARSFALGVVVLSLNFLISYCGMISLAQMTLAGVAAYTFALLSPNVVELGLPLPWPAATLAAILNAGLVGALVGLIAQQATGVYLLMLTLAIAVCILNIVQPNMELFNGFDGISGIAVPAIGPVAFNEPAPLYAISLTILLLLIWGALALRRTPFGLVLQALRDSPRRMRALGFPVVRYKVAAFALSGAVAGIGGVLITWYSPLVSPGTIDANANINILIMCVLGGVAHPIGAAVGALVFVLLENFAIQVIAPDRFNLVIGGTFLLVLLFSPQGIVRSVRMASLPKN